MINQENPFRPDFQKHAASFDTQLPLIAAVADALLASLSNLSPGSRVLDIACGTGEPGLTLARTRPDILITGIDAAENMIQIAREKSAREGLTNADFCVMQSEHLTFQDESFDAIVSRFGLGMFGDTTASAKEMARVLKRQGCFSVAVWHDMSLNVLVQTIVEALRTVLPEEFPANAFDKFPGAMAAEVFKEAGLRDLEQMDCSWNYHFQSDKELEAKLLTFAAGLFEPFFEKLDAAETVNVLSSVSSRLQRYQTSSGSFDIPHTCRLLWGRKI
jgi:ubiquinone/menaquinone biosynthesis C-methylase UbiE